MAQYAFHARTRTGRSERGSIEAANPDEAVSLLQDRDLLIVRLSEQPTQPFRLSRRARRYHKGVRHSDLILFARSIEAMTEAGLPLLRSLETTETQIRSRRLSHALKEVVQDIRGGSTFRDALAKHPTIFSPFWVTLVETAEASGQLTRTMHQIAVYLEKSGVVRRKVVSALIYPAILLLVATVAVFIFTLNIIPTFASLFTGFGAQLPWLTRMVIAFSRLLQSYFLVAALGLGAAIFLFSRYLKTRIGRWQRDWFLLAAPIFGPVFQGIAAEQFASNLGVLLRAGVPILHALDITITTCGNKVVAALLENMEIGVREGKPLAEPLLQTDLFPPMVAQMISVGEQTGKLPDMLEQISRYYEEQVSTAVERMTALLEPIMLIFLGTVIGTLVISMYLPIFQISQTIQ